MWDGKKYNQFQSDYQYHAGTYLINKIEMIYDLESKYIVDLGCGNGSLTSLLSEKSKTNVVGIDLDSSMLESFRENYKTDKIEMHKSDILQWLSNVDKKYDMYFSNATLHWLGSHDNLYKLIVLCKKTLKEKGLFAVRFSLKNNAFEIKQYLEEKLQIFLGKSDLPYLQQSQLDFNIFCEQLESCNYKLKHVEEINYTPFENHELDFKFMLYSQPIKQYFDDEKFNQFAKYLESEWAKESVVLKSHHGVYIAESS